MQKYDIRHISGDIVLDNSKFLPEEFLGRGWMWDDKNPLIGALAVKGCEAKENKILILILCPWFGERFFLRNYPKKE
jgi:hypothetical protein